jgi:hypothetical protein
MSAINAKTVSAMSSVSHLKAWSPKCGPVLAFVIFNFVFYFVGAEVTRLKLLRADYI